MTEVKGQLLPSNEYTPELLASMAKQAPGLPVTLNFDANRPVGRVTSAEVRDDGLHVTVNVELPAHVHVGALGPRLAPGILERKQGPQLREVSFGTGA